MADRIRRRVGDIVQIPLPNGLFAAGRLYKEASIAISAKLFQQPVSLTDVKPTSVAFVTACFDTAITDGSWPIIGRIPFDNDEDAWAPPRYVEDIIKAGTYRIYHKGQMRAATSAEVRGLEKAEMYKPDQLVERIIRELDGKAT